MAFPTKEMIHLHSPTCYFFYSFLGSLVVRLIQCYFRTKMPDVEWQKMKCWKRYWKAFKGQDPQVGDHWFPYLLGVAELLAYPILFHFEQVTAIGGWIALKTAGNWGVWQKSRTVFYNFLLGNIYIIFISYFLRTNFVIDP